VSSDGTLCYFANSVVACCSTVSAAAMQDVERDENPTGAVAREEHSVISNSRAVFIPATVELAHVPRIRFSETIASCEDPLAGLQVQQPRLPMSR
jgi:hypothetical protein